MSNGNDHPKFPPPPSSPPEGNNSGSGAETSAVDNNEDTTIPEESNDAARVEPSQSVSEPKEQPEQTHADAGAPADSAPDPSEESGDGNDPARFESTSDQETVAMNVSDTRGEEPSAPEPPAAGHHAPSFGAPPRPAQPDQAPSYQQNQAPQPDQRPQYGSNQAPQYGSDQVPPFQPQQSPRPSVQQQPPSNQNYQAQPGYIAPQGSNLPPQNPNPVPPNAGPYYNAAPQQGSGPNQAAAPNQTGSGSHGQSQPIPQPAPAPGFAGASATATRAEARPRGKKSKVPLFIALGSVLLVLVLVAVGFFVIRTVNKNNYGPDKIAEEYVAALSKGDFAAAEQIAPSPRPEGTNLDLLGKDFTENSSAKIENAKVVSSDVKDEQGNVIISYDLDGNTYQVSLPAKKDGKQDLFFDKWTLTGPALHVISIDVPAVDGLTVNGTEYKTKSGTTAFAVYPGNYDFKLPASKWVQEASDTAAVNFPQSFAPGAKPNTDQVAPLNLNLSLSATPEFQKEVQKQVEAELKKCFDNKDIKPKCKFINFDPSEIPVSGEDKKLSDLAKKNTAEWKMKEMPKVKTDFSLGDPGSGSFFTDKPGKFDFSVDGTKRGMTYFSNNNPLSVSGSVKIEGDKLSVEFF